jgi:hypothetical protein
MTFLRTLPDFPRLPGFAGLVFVFEGIGELQAKN